MEDRNPSGQQCEEDSPTNTYTKTSSPSECSCVQSPGGGGAEGLGKVCWAAETEIRVLSQLS